MAETDSFETQSSFFRTLILEIGFILFTVIAPVITVVILILGTMRYVMRGSVYPSPLFSITRLWSIIGKHFVGLSKESTFSRSTNSHYRITRNKITALREKMYSTGVWIDMTEIDYVDVDGFFALLGSLLTYGKMMAEVIIGIGLVTAAYPVLQSYQSSQSPQASITHTTVIYRPQVADEQDANFGPWDNEGLHYQEARSKNFKNIAMITETGEIRYSKSKVGNLEKFLPAGFSDRVENPQVTNDGRITFHDPHRLIFTVNPNQVFMVEGYVSEAFYFDVSGQLYTIPLKQLTYTENRY